VISVASVSCRLSVSFQQARKRVGGSVSAEACRRKRVGGSVLVLVVDCFSPRTSRTTTTRTTVSLSQPALIGKRSTIKTEHDHEHDNEDDWGGGDVP
jgi:hypothetical protein